MRYPSSPGREALLEPRLDQDQGQKLIRAPRLDRTERHDFDQGEIEPPCVRPFEHRDNLVLVHALKRHHIDLDRQPRRLRGIDPGHGLGVIAPAGDRLIFRRVERIERHVETAHACLREFLCVLRELGPVCREGQFVERARTRCGGRARGTAA